MGGKSKNSAPTTTDDNLFSQDVFELLLAFGEGTIYGLVDGFKSFYLDGTPLLASDGSFNFQDFGIGFRQGYADDLPVNMVMGGVSSPIAAAAGVLLPHGIVRSYSTDPSKRGTLTRLDFRIAVNTLFTGDAKGNTGYGSAKLEIKYKKTSDTYWRYINNDNTQVVEDATAAARAAGQAAYNLAYVAMYAATHNSVLATDAGRRAYDHEYDIAYAAHLTSVGADPNTGGTYRIVGKTTSGYILELSAALDPSPDDDWEIQLTKLSNDPTATEAQYNGNSIGISSIAQVGANDRAYPNTVIAQIVAQATSRFSSLPNFTGEFYGLMVDVPTNYNPWTRTYDESSVWGGTYRKAWTNNPVWICREIIMNTSWGIRKTQHNVQINNSSFYSAAKYCDEMLLDFDGNMSPRHTYNEYKQDKQDITEYLTFVAGSFHAVFRERNGIYTLHIDRPQDAIFFLCPETCVVGSMVYAATDMSTRYNFVRANYANKDYNYTGDRRLITDPNSIAKYGTIEYEFNPAGVTNRTEAIRAAAYTVLTNRDESLLITATVPQLGLLLNLYDNFYVADKDAGLGNSARILSYDTGTRTIHLRDPITVSSGTYDITWHNASGLIKRTATTVDAYTLVLDSATTFTEAGWLFDDCPIMIEGGSYGYAKRFRVMGIADNSTSSGDGSSGIPSGVLFSISGSQVSPAKYTALNDIQHLSDYGLSFDSTQAVATGVTSLSIPSNIQVTATTDGKYNISFNSVSGAEMYQVSWKNMATGEERSMLTPSSPVTVSPAFPVDGTTPITFTVIAEGSGLTSAAGIKPNYIPQFATSVVLPDIVSMTLIKGKIVASWDAETASMPAYDKIIATYSTPDSGIHTTTLANHSQSAGIVYDGAGTYNLQLTYQVGNPVPSAQFNSKIWSYTAPYIPPIVTPILGTTYSSTTGMLGNAADAGYAFVQFDCQVPDFNTNPLIGDDPLEIQYEKALGTGIFEETPDDFMAATIDATHFRGIIVPQLKIGQKVRFRTTADPMFSDWVTFTVSGTMVTPPSPSPSDVFLTAAGM